MRRLIRTQAIVVAVGIAAFTSVGARAKAIIQQPPPSVSLADALIGDWTGYLIDANRTFGFKQTEVSFRFNRSGAVSVHRYPWAGPGLTTGDAVFTADYQVVAGKDVVLSVPGSTVNFGFTLLMVDVTLTNRRDPNGGPDHAEFVLPTATNTGPFLPVGGYVLDRVRP